MPARVASFPPNQPSLIPLPNSALQLRVPKISAKAQFEKMIAELNGAGESHHYGSFQIATTSFERYLQLVLHLRDREDDRYEGVHPIHTFFIYYQQKLAGELRYRERLAPEMQDLGGHITLYVRPSMRRKGIANEALKQMLVKAGERQRIITVLLACLSNNLAAIKIMQRNGGINIPDVETPMGTFKRYRFFLPRPR